MGPCTFLHPGAVLVLLLGCSVLTAAQSGGVISFGLDSLVVSEGPDNVPATQYTQVAIPLVRVNGTYGIVAVTVQIQNQSATDHFLALNGIATFNDGDSTASASFTVINNNTPKPNQTYLLQIISTPGMVGTRKTMLLTILASDEPAGRIQFNVTSLIVSEPVSARSYVRIPVVRGPGIYGAVSVNFQVTQGPNLGLNDLSPTQGSISLDNLVASQNITLAIVPNILPTPNVTFVLTLLNPGGGALLATKGTQASITIVLNSPPIKFSQSTIQVATTAGSVLLTVTRGFLDGSSSLIGPVATSQSTVNFATTDGMALANSDYVPLNGTVTFQPGTTSQTITVYILNNPVPHGNVNFTVYLFNPSSDCLLYPPSAVTVTVLLSSNAGGMVSFASSSQVVVNRDGYSVANLTIQRSVGMITDVVVVWSLRNADNSLAFQDFLVSNGTITIPAGQSQAVLTIKPLNDGTPKPAQLFYVNLDRVLSGLGQLDPTGTLFRTLIVADSNDFYGLIEWADATGTVTATAGIRTVQLNILREAASNGIIVVTCSLLYQPPGSSALDPNALLTPIVNVTMQGGQTTATLAVQVQTNVFLEPTGTFYAFLNKTSLVGGAFTLVTPTNSPRIGARSSQVVAVGLAAASGPIGFAASSLVAQGQVPVTGLYPVPLQVVRSGTFGQATVSWVIAIANPNSVSSTAGTVVIQDGATSATFSVFITANHVPELDQQFNVTLTSVAEPNQRILLTQNQASVAIPAHDYPAGIFSFSATSIGPYYITKSLSTFLQLAVQRMGGALSAQQVVYSVVPDGGSHFYGSVGVLYFGVNQLQSTIGLAPIVDGIPQTNQTYTVVLAFPAPTSLATFGSPSNVSVTILATDDFRGVVYFLNTSLSFVIVEPHVSVSGSTATLTVYRDRGAFGTISVLWSCTTSGANTSISPVSGSLVFQEGQRLANFTVSALDDGVPESNITYSMTLVQATEGAKLSYQNLVASVTILANDDPISFAMSSVIALEGTNATFVVVRGGRSSGVAVVNFAIVYQTASSSDVIVYPPGGVITFQDGQSVSQITMVIVSDGIPELDETLVVRLVSLSVGDAVLVPPTDATLLIPYNDYPNGLFQFAANSRAFVANEGTYVTLNVERLKGTIGTVQLQWEVASNSSRFSPALGYLTFAPGETTKSFRVLAVADGVPALQETFDVDLSILSNTSFGDGLAYGFETATITIPDSNYPYGVFRIPPQNHTLFIALNVPANNPGLGMMTIPVERTYGLFGSVQVLWEIYDQVTLPSFVDLFLVGLGTPWPPQSQPRPSTGTKAFNFTGVASNVVYVPSSFHPTISNGFTISCWIYPSATSNGVLIAKTNSTTTTIFYALSLVANGASFIISFSYLPSTQTTGFRSVQTSVPTSRLTGGWHSLAVSVSGSVATMYVDGAMVTTSVLLAPPTDGAGVLTVGGLPIGVELYTGGMQDARIYPSPLNSSQIASIGNSSVGMDLYPTSGIITYLPQVMAGSISFASINHSTPQPNKYFYVMLTFSNGGSQISSQANVVQVIELKGNNANGIFGFASNLSTNISEPGNLSLIVTRQGGTYDTVTLTWAIVPTVQGASVVYDFVANTSQVVFPPGVRQAPLVITTFNDGLPSLSQRFTVVLLSVVSGDGFVSTTPTSGASINILLSRWNITVLENDYPYGLLQFNTTLLPPPGTLIPAATSSPVLYVDKSNRTVIMVYVARAMGTVGTVSVDYRTQDGTASSSSATPHYVTTGGTLSFSPTDQVKAFPVTILDNLIPELWKSFSVVLANPRGDMGVPSIGSPLTITLRPSHDAAGVFAFSGSSSLVVVVEGTSATVTIVRGGGSQGNASVSWFLVEQTEDLTPTSGTVTFSPGQTSTRFTVAAVDDMIPEFQEVYHVMLINATNGSRLNTTGLLVVNISIPANHYPCGLFVFDAMYRSLLVNYMVGSVELAVSREFGTAGNVGVAYATLDSESAAVTSLVPPENIATAGVDFVPTSGTLWFAQGETIKTFNITILANTIPKLDVYVFVNLTSAFLVSGAPTDPLAAPSVSSNESLASVVIAEHNNARGIVEFDSPFVVTIEPSSNFLLLRRRAGTYGVVSVMWSTIPGSATAGSDYYPTSGSVTFQQGDVLVPAGLTIVDDNIPEFNESLTVVLTSASGGAVLGTVLEATVLILANDDPNGALEFDQSSRLMLVNTPPDGTATPLVLTVQRIGGAVGVIGVDWSLAPVNGSEGTADIQPSSGHLVFISGDVTETVTIWLQPDNTPSVTEEFDLTLINPVGGARVTTNGVARILVLAHDNPYGTVSMLNANTILAKGVNNTVEMIPIVRSGGTFEDLIVTYSIQQLDLAAVATSDGTSPLAYFFATVANTTLTGSLLRSVNTTALSQCASACLSDETCLSFSQLPSSCQLYLATLATGVRNAVPGASYYEKNQTKVRPFLLSIARSPNDFIATTGTVIFPAGASTAGVPVVIVTNHTPKLDQSFSVTLLSVQLRYPSTDPANLSPSLGGITTAKGTILAHDDPYGRFYLVGSNGEHTISVPRVQNLAIVLTVQRQGGTIGNVAVGWSAYNGTAQQGVDYIATGAVLVFSDGMTSQSFLISILNDGKPSRNKNVLLTLVNPVGGAVIAPGGGGLIDVVILASNRAAGIVGFSPLSRSAVVGAGTNVTLVVQRQWSALGVVQVTWNISGSENVTQQFSAVSGTALFAEGVNITTIVFGVINDSTPKLTTPYTVQLTSAQTLSADITTPEAIAQLDPASLLATITVNASNYPHGVVEFQQQFVVGDQLSPVQVTLVREYGTFGAIDVTYQARVGTLRTLPLPNDTSLATLGVNFADTNLTVRFLDGQQSVTIAAPIIADRTPALNKVFLVTLLSVSLVNSSDPTAPPILGALNAVEVTILPHDNPQGILTFRQTDLYVNVTQSVLDVPVLRTAGTFGTVSTIYYVVSQNATNGSDYIVANYLNVLTFAPGQSVGYVQVAIIFNSIPSLSKSFCITLYQPQGGAVLGNITTTCVTILAHDDPYGVFSIDVSTTNLVVDVASLTPNANVATVLVVRGGGTLGAITVPFQIQPSPNTDLSPLSGAVQFRQGDQAISFQLTASSNNIPSLNKTYNVTLLPPLQGRLGNINTVATVTILAHSHPYGLFEVFAGVNESSYVVEETAGTLSFTVRRSYGLFGNVTLLLSTADGSAVANVDYVPLYVSVAFAQGETNKEVSVAIISNELPRIDGMFYVVIVGSTGGADIGDQSSVNVTILSHDNAYGLIGFAKDSHSVIGQVSNLPNPIQLVVVRQAGVFGEVHVAWNVSNNNNMSIAPSSGEAVFLNGSSTATITLYIQPDPTPKLDATFPVVLQAITQNGLPPGGDPSRGAQLLPGLTVASVTIPAHNDPYGVFVWSPSAVNASQSDVAQTVAVVSIARQAGTVGTVLIQYSTVDATSVLDTAQSGIDYVPVTSGRTSLLDGETVSNISITILPQDVLKPVRCFLVNITSVTLMGQAQQGVYPHTNGGQTAVTVCVMQDVVNRGQLNFNAVLNYQGTIGVTEDVGFVFIPVSRTLGSVGTVGVTYNVTGVTAVAGADYTSNATSLLFSPSQVTQYIKIAILIDSNPHPDKTLVVTLATPIGGCTLGTWQSVIVTILKNADYNGVFSFTSDSLLFLVPVSQTPTDPLGVATLKVQRARSFFGTVVVYWEVETAGRTALTPTNGSVVFAENVILQTFQVRTVNTGMSQPMEAFQINLVSLEGAGGRIADPSRATVAIQATTAVTPVIGFASYPTGIVITQGNVLTFKLVQSIPTQGTTSSASWAITPADSSLFVTVTDTVLFTTGLQSVTVSVQTLSNTIPTTPRAYTVTLVSTTQATLNTSASHISLYVPAANNPRGSVQFAQGTYQAPKAASTVAVPLQRGGGVAGTLVVGFTVQSYPTAGYTAQNASDFTLSSQSVTIPDGSALGSIPVQIIDDMVPAPNKTFAITLTSVTVRGGLGANLSFTFPGDPASLDQAPTLGVGTQLLFTILQRGNPYGAVSFRSSQVRVSVGDTVQLNLTRSGGTYGTIATQFVLVNGLASSQDYTLLGGGGAQVVFNPGQSSASLFLYINSNSVGTSAADFSVVLTSVSGGGSLGNSTTATVIIAATVVSNGVVGFTQSTVSVNKPGVAQGPSTTTLTVNRVGSTTGVTNIQWRVSGPTPGSEALDISSSTLQGTLTLQDGQSSGIIQVIVLPTSVPAVQKTFTVTLTSATNNVAISATAGTLSLVVSQYGNPYGEISFIGNDLTPLTVYELEAAVNTFSLTLVRTGLVTDAATVTFVVAGNDLARSVSPAGGSVTFQTGVSQVQISLSVLSDGVPELDATYTVSLTSATGLAIINALGSVVTFIVPANNYPYGQFGVSSSQLSGDMTSRSLSVSMTRLKGTFGTVQVQLSVVYDPQPLAAYVNRTLQMVFSPNATTAAVSLPVAAGAFLVPFTYFTLTVTNATAIVPVAGDGGTRPFILLANSTARVLVSPNVSNPMIGFDQGSLEAQVDDSLATNNVQLSVTRQGLLGVVTVTWSSIGNGTITPSSGVLQMGPGDSIATFSLTATPARSYGPSEVFAVQLSAVTQSNLLFPAGVDPARAQSIIEPRGVVQILPQNYTSIEGQLASVIIWRRYGSSQDIIVTGMGVAPDQSVILQYEVAAVPGVDFVATPLSVTIPAGSTWGTIQVPLLNNTLLQRLRVFQFVLTSVVKSQGIGASSPRLLSKGPNGTVTIIDAQGGSGIFGFSASSVSVNVLGSPIVPVVVFRAGGSYGRVSVTVTTYSGTPAGVGAKAISGQSYLPVNVTLVFEEGVTQLQLPSGGVQIIDDNIPSVTKYLTVSLGNPSGGFALLSPNLANLVIAIEAHDYPGGVVAFTTTSPITLIDSPVLSASVSVGRSVALVAANVTWTAVYPVGTSGQSLSNLLVATTGTVSFQVDQTSSQFILTLNTNQVPLGGVQFLIRLSTSDPLVTIGGTDLTVNAQTSRTSVFQFAEASRNLVVTQPGAYTLTIQRVDGLMLTANVTYSLVTGATAVSAGMISLSPALATRHYTTFLSRTLTFTPTTNQVTIQVNIILVDPTSPPLGFQVVISTSQPNQVQSSTSTIVITPLGAQATLLGYYFSSLIATSSFDTLESLSEGLLGAVSGGQVTGLDSIQAQSVRLTLDQLTQTASTISSSYSAVFKSNIQQIFDHLLQDSSFSGQYRLSDSLKSFGYSLLSALQCGANGSQIIRATSFYLEAVVASKADLHDRVFSSGDGVNYVRFPSEDLLDTAQCLHVVYLEYIKHTIFAQPTLNSMALSIGIQEQTPNGKLNHPITYRIGSGGIHVLPTRDICFYWSTTVNSTGLWVTGVSTGLLPSIALTPVIQQGYVDCQCSVLGDLAVSTITDAYGWTLPAAISCAFVMFAMLLILLLHLVYFKRTLSTTRVFLMLCFSVLAFQLVTLADMFATSDVSSGGCIALGVFLQLTVVAQFMWILSLVVNLWLSLMGLSNGRDPLFAYVLASWGVSVVVVVLTLVIGRYAVLYQFTDIYGLTADKSICFIPNVPTVLLSTALPIVVAILLAVGLLSHSCYNWSRWEDYHNMYHDSFNKRDIPLLLTFFVLVFVTCLVGGLQMYLTKVYWFGAFVALNTLQGIYALVVYFFSSWQTLALRHKKYGIGNDVEPLTIPGEPDFFHPASLNSSQRQLSPYALEMKGRPSRSPQSPPVVQLEMKGRPSRSPHSPPIVQFNTKDHHSLSPQEEDPIVPLGIKAHTEDSEVTREHDPAALSRSEDSENEDMDALVYAVRTRGTATEDYDSDRSSVQSSAGSEVEFAPRQKASLMSEEYQLRRISIANTHL